MEKKIFQLASIFLIIILMQPLSLIAYVGPGTGMSAIGAFIAFVLGIFVAILGFIWYPIKRLFQKKSSEPEQDDKTIEE